MIKVYGASDDLLEIEGYDEIDCYDKVVRVCFDDGTVIRCSYSKPGLAVWWIKVERQGTARQSLEVCMDENADPYSDVFTIDAKVTRVVQHRKSDYRKERRANNG